MNTQTSICPNMFVSSYYSSRGILSSQMDGNNMMIYFIKYYAYRSGSRDF